MWYGLFFALGVFLGYALFTYLLKRFFLLYPDYKLSYKVVAEKATFTILLGVIIGARLGDLLFYQNASSLLHDPLLIFKVWEGGLASHGAAAGALLSFALFVRRYRRDLPMLTWLSLFDLVAIPALAAGSLVRIGNFFNQEVLGTPSQLPWAVLFLHPIDGSAIVARHPAQLYESLFYALLAALLFYLAVSRSFLREKGKIAGLFLLLLFSFRFFIEFFKEEQSVHFTSSHLLVMGQYLSLPFIALGTVFLLWGRFRERRSSLREDRE